MRHSINHAGAGAIVADSVTVTGTVTAAALVGPLTGDTAGTHTGPVATDDLRLRDVSVVAPPPNTNAEFEAATGLTSAAWWRLDQIGAAGNVASLGDVTATLATAGTPTFGHPLASSNGGSARGMYFDAATGDACSANVLAPGTTSFISGARVGFVGDPAGTAHLLFGLTKSGASAAGWSIYVNDSGDLVYYVSDGTHVFNATFASAVLPLGSAPVEVVAQLDRTGAEPVLRLRWSRNGATIGNTSVTCTSLGTLTAASQEFGFGATPVATPAFNAGTWVQWGWYAADTQAEGATKAQTVSQGLGWEA